MLSIDFGNVGDQAAFELGQQEINMQTIIAQAKAFISDESGITALEYGILAGLISVLIMGSIASISTTLQNVFSDVANAI